MRLGVIAFVAASPLLAVAMWWNLIKGPERDAATIFVTVVTTIIAAALVYAVTR